MSNPGFEIQMKTNYKGWKLKKYIINGSSRKQMKFWFYNTNEINYIHRWKNENIALFDMSYS